MDCWNRSGSTERVHIHSWLGFVRFASRGEERRSDEAGTGLYRAAQVDSVDCEAEVCTVTLSLTFDYKRTKGITMPLVEKWLISGGKAWFVDRG